MKLQKELREISRLQIEVGRKGISFTSEDVSTIQKCNKEQHISQLKKEPYYVRRTSAGVASEDVVKGRDGGLDSSATKNESK